MANIIIGYKNLLLESGVTVTPGSEAAGFDADNLLIAHPSEYWRASSLATSYVQIDLAEPQRVELIAPLYSSASPLRQQLRETDTWDTSSNWTRTNVTASAGSADLVAIEDDSIITFTASGTGNHTVDHLDDLFAYSTHIDANMKIYLSAQVYVSAAVGNNAKLELELAFDSGTETVSLEVDPATGTINATNTSGFNTLESYGAELIDKSYGGGAPVGQWYRVYFTASISPLGYTGVGDCRWKAYVLNSSYTRSYTAASEYLHLHAPKLSVSTAISRHERNPGTTTGGVWIPKAHTSAITPASTGFGGDSLAILSTSASDETLPDRGFVSSFTTVESITNSIDSYFYRHWLIEFHDADNADSRIDVSNIYLGRAWQPTINVANDWTIRPAQTPSGIGRAYGGQEYRSQQNTPRELTLRLAYESPEDAFAEAHAMGIRQGQHSPILVIIDPDETTYGQEMMIYGVLTNLQIGIIGWFTDRGDGTAGNRYQISMTVRELLP